MWRRFGGEETDGGGFAKELRRKRLGEGGHWVIEIFR